jgi:hypothetical protein
MKIECYMSSACGSEDALRKNIFKAVELEDVTADIKFYRISDKKAESLGLKGSPSVLVNGRDIQPVSITGFS